MPIADTEFLYASALLRAKEGQGIARERFERMADAQSLEEICRLLGECGVVPVTDGEGGRFDLDRTLAAVWQDAAALVRRLSPVEGLFDYLLYPYDANDLKACLKTAAAGEGEPEGMLFSCGTVPAADVRNAVKTKDFSAFPPAMKKAAETAAEDFARTGDPQSVDIPVDRACFADMLASTEREPFLHSLIRLRIDLYHIRCAARTIRMGEALPAPETYLKRFFVSGGNIPTGELAEAVGGGLPALAEVLSRHGERALASAVENGTPETLERACDDRLTAELKKTKYQPFGAAVLAAYAGAAETAAKNIRIVCTMKASGLPADLIRERLRDCYV